MAPRKKKQKKQPLAGLETTTVFWLHFNGNNNLHLLSAESCLACSFFGSVGGGQQVSWLTVPPVGLGKACLIGE